LIEQACDAAGVMVIFRAAEGRCGVLPGLRKQLAMQAVKEYGKSFDATSRSHDITANAVGYMLKIQ
jgi:hypothetical protein